MSNHYISQHTPVNYKYFKRCNQCSLNPKFHPQNIEIAINPRQEIIVNSSVCIRFSIHPLSIQHTPGSWLHSTLIDLIPKDATPDSQRWLRVKVKDWRASKIKVSRNVGVSCARVARLIFHLIGEQRQPGEREASKRMKGGGVFRKLPRQLSKRKQSRWKHTRYATWNVNSRRRG